MKQRSFVTIGIPSILTIFGILTMIILSLMSLGTSQQDERESRLSLDQTKEYYNSCTEATEIYEELFSLRTAAGGEPVGDKIAGYLENLPERAGEFPALGSVQDGLATVEIRFSPRQSLIMEVSLTDFSIQGWYTAKRGDWVPKATQKLFRSVDDLF